MPLRIRDPAMSEPAASTRRRYFTTRANGERIKQEKEDRKAKLHHQNRRRQDYLRDFPQEVEKAIQELEIQESFFTKLAREENNAKGFSEGHDDNSKTGIASNVRKAKHETAEALRYVYPNSSFEYLTSAAATQIAAHNSKRKPRL